MILKIDSDILSWLNSVEYVIRGSDTHYAKLHITLWNDAPRLGYALYKDAEKLYDIRVQDIDNVCNTFDINIKAIPTPPKELVYSIADGLCRVSFINSVTDYDGYVTKFF